MSLDFSSVTDLARPTAWFTLPSDLELRLAAIPEVQARAQAAVHFAYRVEANREHLYVTEDREAGMREAYFRAALSEFWSLDEAAVREFARLGIVASPPPQPQSTSPLIHAFRLLRHLNVHLTRSSFIVDSRPATIRLGDEVHEVDYALWLVSDFSIASLSALRDSRHYSQSELRALVNWFNTEQREWGVLHMLLLATRHYCEELVALLPPAE